MPQFRTKARAVDLLGKGQIADLPTAITELWKNGYDAYADVLTAQIYLKGYKQLQSPLFVITDDGRGMSRKEIFDKWLVLGTDSKSRSENKDVESEDTLWKKPRIKAGEKGIGRLSVAFLGSPMLMLTKKRGSPLQVLYFDWRLLENYNLFLDDVQIPVEDVKKAGDFKKAFVDLKLQFLKNFDKKKDSDGNLIWEKSQEELKKQITKSTELLETPNFFEDELLFDIIDIKEHNGTKFIIFEPESQILELLDEKNEHNEFIRTSLAGFTNQFKEKSLPIETLFPIHFKVGNDYDFLTSSGNFFEPQDFGLSDILIDGSFDGKGNFKGDLRMYDKNIKYSYSSPARKDQRSDYGPFNIKLGYLMGNESESKLSDTAFDRLKSKITRFGALYIYRDGFRVLPYGRTDYDFLEFEKKRSKRASTAFFSHRRMLGYIEITRSGNENLKDKAGREGLINNAAYRNFKDDLQALFDDLAKEYFGDEAKQSIFLDQKKNLKSQNDELRKDKEREKQEKSAFTKSLKDYPIKFNEYQKNYKSVLVELDSKTKETEVVYSEIEDLLEQINKLDISYKDLLPTVPKRYKPTDTQLDRLTSYENILIEFNDKTKKESSALLKRAKQKLAIQELRKEFIKNYSLYKSEIESYIYDNKQELIKKTNLLFNEFDERTSLIKADLDYQKNKSLLEINTKEDIIEEIDRIKEKFEFLREQLDKEIFPLVKHISKLEFGFDEELIQGAYRAEYEKIKYQWEQTRETAQLGVAVEIIDHEFNVLYSQINTCLRKLNGELGKTTNGTYEHLKTLFSQLEDKYELLSPLYRISGVTPKKITGASINEYLHDFFEKTLKEENIILEASDQFKKHFITIKEPVIHTVYINIVNNAIYWLREVESKKILLDYLPRTDEILIVNSGPSIPEHRLDKIFELFYSNRPNGRGIGLYLAKQSLEENYFDIYATNDKKYNKLDGACFVLKPLNN